MKLDEAVKLIENILSQVNATLPQHQQIQLAFEIIRKAVEKTAK